MASTATGTPAACGARCASTTPARFASIGSVCCAATPTRRGRTCSSTPASTATTAAVSASARSSTAVRSPSQSGRSPAGSTTSAGTSTSTNPALWWPRSLGDQPLTEMSIEVIVDGELSDRRTRRTGLREVAWNDWMCSVNGERLFLKGANLLPTRVGLADATPADMRRDIELAVDAGLDVLRVHGHIAPRPLYDAADELGVLLMQDFPLLWGYARSVRGQAVDQARAAVDQLGHHPVDRDVDRAQRPGRGRHRHRGRQRTQPAPVLDRAPAAVVEQDDPRPVGEAVVREGRSDPTVRAALRSAPPPPAARRHRQPLLLRVVPRRRPRPRPPGARSCRACSGSCRSSAPRRCRRRRTSSIRRSGPTSTGTCSPSGTGCRSGCSTCACRPTSSPRSTSGDTPRRCTKRSCCATTSRLMRRLKYRPTGGFAVFSFNDPGPMVSFSVLDHERVPKLGLPRVAPRLRRP